MKRRELIAGAGSVGLLSGAGVVTLFGGFGGSGTQQAADDEGSSRPITVEPINGAEIGIDSVAVPPEGVDATVITFFSTSCDPCHVEVGTVADARARLADDHGDSLQFLSIPFESPGVITEDELREWWDTYGGDWPVAFDPDSRLKDRYSPLGMPSTTVIDDSGAKHWMNTGPHRADKIVDEIHPVLETDDGE